MSMERGLAFRREAENLLKKAETELMGRVGEQVDAVIRAIGAERGYDFVVDTSAGTHPVSQPRKVGRHYSLRESALAQRAMTARLHGFLSSIPLHT